MRKKCNGCGKSFNVGAFGEEHCPYCGQVLENEDRQNIRNRKYFWEHSFWMILLGIFGVLICISFIFSIF